MGCDEVEPVDTSSRHGSLWSTMDGIEVVVHGDAAHAHRVGDILDRSSQDERAALVEQTDRSLLVGPREHREAAAELGLA